MGTSVVSSTVLAIVETTIGKKNLLVICIAVIYRKTSIQNALLPSFVYAFFFRVHAGCSVVFDGTQFAILDAVMVFEVEPFPSTT